ncbi:MAG TPA: PqqD family protein [Thermotogota bacterium]|nr:PqqD family protein [Thermotogota bacterium]HRW35789.1 PqqD family protein [Thermotogota bacterium]
MIGLNSVIQRKTGLADTEIDTNKVLMSVETGKYYGLNTLATNIWMRIERPMVVSDLINDLVESFDVSLEVAQTEVIAFLNDLKKNKLLEQIS